MLSVKLERFDNKQMIGERILKDMHKDLRIAYCKIKHLVCQVFTFSVQYC